MLEDLLQGIPYEQISIDLTNAAEEAGEGKLSRLFPDEIIDSPNVNIAAIYKDISPVPAVLPGSPALTTANRVGVYLYEPFELAVKSQFSPMDLRAIGEITKESLQDRITRESISLTSSIIKSVEVLVTKALRGSYAYKVGEGVRHVNYGAVPSESVPISGASVRDWAAAVSELITQYNIGDYVIIAGKELLDFIMSDTPTLYLLTGHVEYLQGITPLDVYGLKVYFFLGNLIDEEGNSMPYVEPNKVYIVQKDALRKVYAPPNVFGVSGVKYAVSANLIKADPERLEVVVRSRVIPVLPSETAPDGTKKALGILHISLA